jgi:hypothetical protein
VSESTTAAALAAIALSALPAVGAPLDGGLFAGLTTKKDGTHCAVVLLPDEPSRRLDWHAAIEWAKGLEAAELPTRPVSALLFATVPDQFDREAWYWTAEQDEEDGAYAWSQFFYGGGQDVSRTSYEGRVRAVRLIPLSA